MYKLLKLFQQAPGGTQNTDQIKEILTLLSQMIPKKDALPQEILTNLTLLYLPWLPLSEKQDLEIRFEKRKKQEDDDSEQTALVIYITTINLGRFKISIITNKDCSIKIEIENIKNPTKKADCELRLKGGGDEPSPIAPLHVSNQAEFLEKILKAVNEQTRKDKINAKTELVVLEQREEETEEFLKREVIISPAKNVSPVLIITAQKIVKIILEADEKISLLERRQEMQ